MRLYFLRHAHAEDTHPQGDHHRALTDHGRRAARNAAQVIARLGIAPVKIYTSPRTRAHQTAAIVGEALGIAPQVSEEVNFGFSPDAVARLISDPAHGDADALFVGHEPTFSQTIGAICGGVVQMKKSGLARIDLYQRSPLRGELVWLVTPKLFEVINR